MQIISKWLGKAPVTPIEPVLGQTTAGHEPVDDFPTTASTIFSEEDRQAATDRYITRLESMGIPSPIDWQNPKRRPATKADVSRMYEVNPSFVDMLPWAEYLPRRKPCSSRMASPGPRSSSWSRSAPRGVPTTGFNKPEMRCRVSCRTASTSWKAPTG